MNTCVNNLGGDTLRPIYVIGHKNPDMDSIAAAISYKIYKQSTDRGLYVAAAAGLLNEESRYVLEKLEFDPPFIVKNVSTRVEDLLDTSQEVYIKTDMNLIELGNLMREHNLKTVPVLDEDKKFLGLVTIGDLAMIFLDRLGRGKDVEQSPRILKDILEQRAGDIMKTRNLILFEKDEPVEEARKHMLSTRFRNYPVVDEKNRYMGMISRYNLLEMKRKQLILVDHNEVKQAVDGVEEAEILEIIDHHRVGDVQTITPIYFRNEPLGSTCTLVAEMFLYEKIYVSRNLSALLLAGILSDTMLFKSPTTTAKDQRIAAELQYLCGLDPVSWGKQILENSLPFEKQTEEEIIEQDLKEYSSGDMLFAISQVETIDLKKAGERKSMIIQKMEEMCHEKDYAFMCMMLTDIMREGTELIIAGDKKHLAAEAFGHMEADGSIFLTGVMSRKKQVVPVIYQVFKKHQVM